MKVFSLITITLLVALFQTIFWDLNFLLILVLIFSFFWSEIWAYSAAFLAGLLLDLLSGNQLGFSSLGFLVPTFLILLYRQKFSFHNPLIILVATLAYYLFFSQVTGRPVQILEMVSLAVIFVIFRLVASPLFESPHSDRLRI